MSKSTKRLGRGLDSLVSHIADGTPKAVPDTPGATSESKPQEASSVLQAEGAAPIVRNAPVANPQTIASAIRIGNPATWQGAVDARDSDQRLVGLLFLGLDGSREWPACELGIGLLGDVHVGQLLDLRKKRPLRRRHQ